jgi:hypothetical protein
VAFRLAISSLIPPRVEHRRRYSMYDLREYLALPNRGFLLVAMPNDERLCNGGRKLKEFFLRCDHAVPFMNPITRL